MLVKVVLLAPLMVALMLTGCGYRASSPGGDSGPRVDQSTVTVEPGVGSDEAEREGVLTGPFDAVLLPRGGVDGSRTFVLRNVGSQSDGYVIFVEGSQSSVEPASAELAPGDEVTVKVTFPPGEAEGVELVVSSLGRGAEVARLPALWSG